jgi:AraC-like DNA-binding protein
MTGTLSAAVAATPIPVAASRGVDAARLFGILGITPSQANDPDLRIPIERVFSLWAACMREVGDPAFPLRVAETVRLERYHVLGFAILTSASARDALERVARFARLVSDSGRWSLRMAAGAESADLLWAREAPRTLGVRTANECAVAELVHAFRQACAGEPARVRVAFAHPAPPDVRAHAQLFGARPVFDADEDRVTVPAAALDIVPRAANPALCAYLERQLEASLQALGDPNDLPAQVDAAVVELLASGVPSSRAVARRLATSERSLRRRLSERGVTFRAVVEGVQRRRAEQLLALRKHSITEIAFLLGFSETCAFTRAFKRWLGVPPMGYRPS